MRILEISIDESIKRIIETTLLTRVMRPEFGSNMIELIDKPINTEWRMLFIAYAHDALEKNEDRIMVKNITFLSMEPLSVQIDYIDVRDKSENRFVFGGVNA